MSPDSIKAARSTAHNVLNLKNIPRIYCFGRKVRKNSCFPAPLVIFSYQMNKLRAISAVGWGMVGLALIGCAERADAVTCTLAAAGPPTWTYNITFAPLDNYSVSQANTTITITGLTGV